MHVSFVEDQQGQNFHKQRTGEGKRGPDGLFKILQINEEGGGLQ
jgi:hypothetical protein